MELNGTQLRHTLSPADCQFNQSQSGIFIIATPRSLHMLEEIANEVTLDFLTHSPLTASLVVNYTHRNVMITTIEY